MKVDMGHIGCHADVIDVADVTCSGRRGCHVGVPDTRFEALSRCIELQSYLEASFECVQGAREGWGFGGFWRIFG